MVDALLSLSTPGALGDENEPVRGGEVGRK
jgi:hypothetical protein